MQQGVLGLDEDSQSNQPGNAIFSCNKFAQVQGSDYCSLFAAKNDITTEQAVWGGIGSWGPTGVSVTLVSGPIIGIMLGLYILVPVGRSTMMNEGSRVKNRGDQY